MSTLLLWLFLLWYGMDANDDGTSTTTKGDRTPVIVEITERIEPCGNLCKLPFINNGELYPSPLDKVKACQTFLLWLDQLDGLRGWYGKIIGEGGVIRLGDEVSVLAV